MLTTRSLILHPHEIRAALRGELRLVVRPVESVKRIGRVTEFGPSDTPGYEFIMRDSQERWNDLRHADLLTRCPLGVPGTRLCCKERWAHDAPSVEDLRREYFDMMRGEPPHGPYYRADGTDKDAEESGLRWRSPANMPAWASRITLEVVSVGVCRVQELCGGKGFESMCRDTWNASYAAKGLGWDNSPWCWKVAVKGGEL